MKIRQRYAKYTGNWITANTLMGDAESQHEEQGKKDERLFNTLLLKSKDVLVEGGNGEISAKKLLGGMVEAGAIICDRMSGPVSDDLTARVRYPLEIANILELICTVDGRAKVQLRPSCFRSTYNGIRANYGQQRTQSARPRSRFRG